MNLFSKLKRFGFRNQPSGVVHSTREFQLILERERARADRSGDQFSLVVFDFENRDNPSFPIEYLTRVLCSRIRITDSIGWHDEKSIGVILPGTAGEGAWKFADDVCKIMKITASSDTCRVYTYPMLMTVKKGRASEGFNPEEIRRQRS